MSKEFKVFAINPGSTSTKIALFEGAKVLFSKNVSHESSKLDEFPEITDQYSYRKQTILDLLAAENVSLEGVDAFVGRGGGLLALEGGVYEIDETILEHAKIGANGIKHPAQLGPILAKNFCDEYGGRAFIVNPPDVDEFQELARMTGIKGITRSCHLHSLNLKETAIRHAETMGKKYEECNFVVCHIGGGISVSAHKKGRMVDGNDIVGGEGPMAPTRCGEIPAGALIKYCFSGKDVSEVKALVTKNGGFVSLLGTSDALEVSNKAAEGDKECAMVWNTMIYQIIKYIGSMANVLHGQVDAILLGGGMVFNKDLVKQITDSSSWIAPVFAYPGEFEMEAMAAGAGRALNGTEVLKKYSGKAIWTGFDFSK